MGRRRVVMSSMLLSGVMVIGMVLAGNSALFVLFIALVGFFLYAMRSVLQAWAIEVTPKKNCPGRASRNSIRYICGG